MQSRHQARRQPRTPFARIVQLAEFFFEHGPVDLVSQLVKRVIVIEDLFQVRLVQLQLVPEALNNIYSMSTVVDTLEGDNSQSKSITNVFFEGNRV